MLLRNQRVNVARTLNDNANLPRPWCPDAEVNTAVDNLGALSEAA
jgi:hypothetical protein